MQNSFLNVLRYPDFKKMWLSQVFSQLALNMLTFALVLHIFDLTGKTTSISLVMIATAIPVAIVGPVSGVLADKFNYRNILINTNFLRFAAVVLLLLASDNVLAILEIIFLISAISQIFTPAESSSVPLIVPQEKLVSANSTVMTTTYATLLIGYSLAGPLLDLVGPVWLYVLCAVLYLAAAQSTRMLSNFDKKEIKSISLENLAQKISKVWHEMKSGFDYLLKKKEILNPMIKLTIGWTILGAIITLLPAYGTDALGISTKFIGPAIIAPAGVGMLISAAMLSRKKKLNYDRFINKGFLLVGISLLIFSFYFAYQLLFGSRIILIALVILIGFGSSMIQIPAQTLLHLNSDEDKRGRVFGISSMQLRLATSLPALIVGGISDLTSPLITMIILSIGVFIYSLMLLFE